MGAWARTHCADGEVDKSQAVLAADGLTSTLRRSVVDDELILLGLCRLPRSAPTASPDQPSLRPALLRLTRFIPLSGFCHVSSALHLTYVAVAWMCGSAPLVLVGWMDPLVWAARRPVGGWWLGRVLSCWPLVCQN